MLALTMPADVNIWILGGAGFAAGLLGSMLGIGGGFIIVPVLTLALGLPIQYAIGSSLISIVINACTATSVYIRLHMTNLQLGLLLSCALVPGAVAGAFLAASLSSPVLTTIFGLLMVYVAYLMMPKKHRRLAPEQAEASKKVSEKDHAPHAWLDGCYYDPAVNREIDYQVHRPVTGLVTSFFAGVLSSLLGIGGGIVNVPVMNRFMKVPLKATIATSALLLAFTTMTGAIIYIFNGYVVPYIVAPLIICVFLGARLGAALAHRSRSVLLMWLFTFFMAVTAVLMILKALNLLG
ncbi:MAG: sulfite exporter TauE/SafE family protein [Dehalococcoidia bacterium]|nr:sulfite exporter TauE/SafE family protein [Dehalococcoidia bacterium]